MPRPPEYCLNCGAAIPVDAAACPECGADEQSGWGEAARYAGLALLGLTVAKLFLHDLSQLEQLYRIGAFVIVAIIAILASFLYQRFLAAAVKQ